MMTLMDGVYRTTKYGFPCFFLVVKTSLGMGRVVGTIIPQQENEILLRVVPTRPRTFFERLLGTIFQKLQ